MQGIRLTLDTKWGDLLCPSLLFTSKNLKSIIDRYLMENQIKDNDQLIVISSKDRLIIKERIVSDEVIKRDLEIVDKLSGLVKSRGVIDIEEMMELRSFDDEEGIVDLERR